MGIVKGGFEDTVASKQRRLFEKLPFFSVAQALG